MPKAAAVRVQIYLEELIVPFGNLHKLLEKGSVPFDLKDCIALLLNYSHFGIIYPKEKNMYAERLILETDTTGHIKRIPILPANKQIEAIFLVLSETVQPQPQPRRHPHPDIAGKGKVIGNIIDAIPESDWNLSK